MDLKNWILIEPKRQASRPKEKQVRFVFLRSKLSPSIYGSVHISKDIAEECKMIEIGKIQVFFNKDNHKQFFLKANNDKKSYTVHIVKTKKETINFIKINFRVDVKHEQLTESDFKTRNIEFQILDNNEGIVIDAS